MSTVDHMTPAARRSPLRSLSWWQAIAFATVAAAIVNLVILVLARAIGASFALVDGAGLHVMTAAGVLSFTVFPLVAGSLLATLLGLVWPGFIRLGQVVGGGLALLSVAGPVIAQTDYGTQFALATMHVVVGVAVVVSLEPIWRHAKARRAQ